MGAAVGSPVDPARKQKPSAINVLTLPIQNPVFLAFAPCGTRLAMLNARRSGDEFSLHSLDLAVALSSLYGAADGRSGAFAPRDMSREACESLSLMKVSKELSFAFGPRSLDVLALVDGVGVAARARPARQSPRDPRGTFRRHPSARRWALSRRARTAPRQGGAGHPV